MRHFSQDHIFLFKANKEDNPQLLFNPFSQVNSQA